VTVLGAALGILLLGVAAGLHHEAYGAFLRALVAERVGREAGPPDAVAGRLHEHVALALRQPLDLPAPDMDVEDTLLRGYAPCDHAVNVLVALLRERGIGGRLTWLRREDGTSPHTVAEVLLDGEWRVFDVAFGFRPHRADGSGATVRDLLGDPGLLGPSRIPIAWYRGAEVRATVRPDDPVGVRGLPAAAVRAVARGLVAGLPRRLADALQDLYLALPIRAVADPRFRPGEPAARLFLRARHYDVALRADAAAAAYRAFLARHPGHPAAQDAWYALGLLELTQRGDPAAAGAALERVLRDYPAGRWGGEGRYLLARAREAAGDCRRATTLYRAVARGQAGGAEDARLRLARLPCA
jgi:hypothetical protein